MGKRSSIIFILLIGLLVLPIFVDAKLEKVSKNLMTLKDNQEARVVVQLKDESSSQKIRAMNSKFDEIPEHKIKYKTGHSIFALLTKEEIETLALSDSIEFISEEKKYQTFLQDSIPLINANASWNLQSLGINLTGQGQTMCIIDTGVNYSHPDLGGCFGNNNVSSDCKVIGGWNTYLNNNNTMDDYGHGTHVAGIAAASGGINGTSIYSRIVMIKANVPSTNGFYGVDIIEGIDWCVNNASKFNITVISMSLGSPCKYENGTSTGWCYDSYCNSEYEAPAINRAIAKNISVVVATGNANNKTSISSPACIQNATPVTSSTKSDNSISNFANIWGNPLLKLLAAPGETINSTYPIGYAPQPGTSMATPHVAGAIAIINQYLKSIGQTKTPDQIEDLLNSTGKQIFDSIAGRNFSRIDIYSALMEIDATKPEVNLISPQDNMINANENQTFICNSSDWQLKNITFYLWNSTNELINSSSTSITGTSNSSSFDVTNLQTGAYKWNCLATDERGNSAFATNNFTVTIGGVSLTLVSPLNETYTNINETTFNCSAITSSDRQMKNMTFYLYENETLINNQTTSASGIENNSVFYFNFTNESEYVWGCEVYSNTSDYDSKNYTIFYDINYPNVSVNSETVTTTTATLSWNTDEETNYSIDLQNKVGTNFSLEHSIIISDLSASTTYTYNLAYCDRAGNCNSTVRSFRTNDIARTSSGGGGGGGGSTQTKLTETQISQGYSKKYIVGEKVLFALGDQNHSIQLNKILNNSVNITLRSEPISLIMQTSEEKKINLTSVEYYDLYIKIENVTKYNANITIRSIEELINPHKIKYDNQTENETEDKGKIYHTFDEPEQKTENKQLFPFYAALILLLIIFFYFLLRKKNSKKEKKDNKKE